MHPLLRDEPGSKVLLLGNEAIVRGAVEAGVEAATSYPGTPSSEIADSFYALSTQSDIYFEFSTNEKVALEVASGAAIAGLRTMCCMKHVGINVAADPLNTISYTGVKAGMVIISADDPSMHSSQNEQDNRYYAKLTLLPMFEPADPVEAMAISKAAFAFSEKLETPVLLRTTTRISHSRMACEFGDMTPRRFQSHFEKNPMRWVALPRVSRQLRLDLLKRQETAFEEMKTLGFDRIEGDGDFGIITAGAAYAYVKEVIAQLGVEERAKILKIASIHPLPRHLIAEVLTTCKRVLVVEELEPYLETEVRAIANEIGVQVEILGKGEEGVGIPRYYELNNERIRPAIAAMFGQNTEQHDTITVPELPTRPPSLCAGCTHRSAFYAVKSATDPGTYFASDIGCYTLGILPPLSTADSVLCMGASIPMASGVSIRNDQKHVAFIGDSTFYHSGMTGLVNAVYNRHNLLLVILDNSTTAMTGHQPHPGNAIDPGRQSLVDLERVVRGLGVDDVHVVNPEDLSSTIAAIQSAYDGKGVRVVISRQPCPLFARKVECNAPSGDARAYRVDNEKCKRCGKTGCNEPCSVEILKDDDILRARAKIDNTECGPYDFPASGVAGKQEQSPCTYSCPANICVLGYVSLIRAGHFKEALALIREQVPLPLTLGFVCHQPCESECVRGDTDDPISIKELKRFVAEAETEEERQEYIDSVKSTVADVRKQRESKKVAVIGSGPAGLTAAFDLTVRGHSVTVFEREEKLGGLLTTAIPPARMPRELLSKEIDTVISAGIDVKTGKTLGTDFTMKQLLDDDFDAVCLAVGAARGLSLGLGDGTEEGIDEALSFLRRTFIEGSTAVGENVTVIGGGDAAIDAACTALRLGAKKASILYRRTSEEMPAAMKEVQTALDEGVEMIYQVQPSAIVSEDGKITALQCVRTEMGEPDESGRRRPVEIPGSEFNIETDHLIAAIGQTLADDHLSDDLELDRLPSGMIRVNEETGATSNERVFCAGDATGQGWTVIDAITQGKKAAYGIDLCLSSDASVEPLDLKTTADLPKERYAPGKVLPAKRIETSVLPPEDRSDPSAVLDATLTAAEAIEESKRCLSCGRCARCNNCIDNFGCPAIYPKDGQPYIDEVQCTGCGVCAQLCPNDAIYPVYD